MEKMGSSWALALVESMRNPLYQVISSDLAVVIKDKYPKSRYHFLVLPWENVPSVFHLTASTQHIQLMNEIELLARNVIEVTGKDDKQFQIGYHASPSMQRLHLHVISTDFDSPCLKTKVHWNSFNTKFFWNIHDVHKEIRRNGKMAKPHPDVSKQWLQTDLRCHQCDYKPKNMPDLKNHLISHIKD